MGRDCVTPTRENGPANGRVARGATMELALTRHDLLQVSTLSRGCMRLLPRPAKAGELQKIAVGDDTGSLQVFGLVTSAKRSGMEVERVFQTPSASKAAISRLELSGEAGSERIYYAAGTLVRGCNRKGKEVLKFATDVTEPIRSMCVEGETIHAAGEFVYNEFVACKESGFLMANDRINDMTLVAAAPQPVAVLACQARVTRPSGLPLQLQPV